MDFKVGKIFLVNNEKKSSKMMLNIILRIKPSPHGEFSVMSRKKEGGPYRCVLNDHLSSVTLSELEVKVSKSIVA